MRSRCFSGPRRAISTSSDRTKAKGDIAIFRGNRSVDPDGRASAQRGVVVARCAQDGRRRVVATQSYELLNSLTRGKYYTDPLLKGATSEARYESWGAAFQSQQYGGTANPLPVSAYTSAPADCAKQSCPWPVGDPKSYHIDYPTGLSGGGGLLAERCIPPPGAKRISPWHAKAKTEFTNTDAFWAARNAQPLQGMVLRAPVDLIGGTCTPSDVNLNREFCQGKGGIN